jgi:hypothetical protein
MAARAQVARAHDRKRTRGRAQGRAGWALTGLGPAQTRARACFRVGAARERAQLLLGRHEKFGPAGLFATESIVHQFFNFRSLLL